jgi:hypothetical protein
VDDHPSTYLTKLKETKKKNLIPSLEVDKLNVSLHTRKTVSVNA